MRDSERTIAVLSPHYLSAMFTQSEWADAFRRDPDGAKDLLIPMRVAPVELQGIFAQIVYVDLVGRDEAEALDLLLKRVKGERLKPDKSPRFPGLHHSPDRLIRLKPVYPAAAEDQRNIVLARDAIVRWRGLYSGKIKELHAAGQLARKWRKEPPSSLAIGFDRLISLANEVAQDFVALPIQSLEFAEPYGLDVHPAVFGGQAMQVISSTTTLFTRARKEDDDISWFMRDDYWFENMARVFESAVKLLGFNLEALPRGYLKPDSSAIQSNLRPYRNLILLRRDSDPRLHLAALDGQLKPLGSFSARTLDLFLLCARRNREGGIDLSYCPRL